ncbi:OsmC family protein [Horticoccus luteus]|uniref:OsmC family protein n=2 Tax=Horticoccus luteus TaxID=2862869 RepID=A0A8F9XMZ5_9BACT|nr:OsmC family protein [Horticoccus luteus]
MVTITGEYEGDLHCNAQHGPSGSRLATDAPKDNQGRGEAFSPTDLVATAYGTCIVTTMAIAARARGVELRGVRFEVTKEMSTQPPRRIARLATKIWVPLERTEELGRSLEAAAHGCPVHRTLDAAVERPIEFVWGA